MHMWYYYVVKKVGCRYSVYKQEISESSDSCFDQYIL